MAKKSGGGIMPDGDSGSKKRRKKGRKAGKRAGALRQRLAVAKGGLVELGYSMGEVGLPMIAANAISGYRGGGGMNLVEGYDVSDVRLLTGVGGIALRASGALPGWNRTVTNLTTGVLLSWLGEKAFGAGAAMKTDAKDAAVATSTPAAAAAPSGGVVLGNIHDGAGAFWQSKEKRLENKVAKAKAKIAKAKAKAAAADIDLDNTPGNEEEGEMRPGGGGGGGGGRTVIVRRGPVVRRPFVPWGARRPLAARPFFRRPAFARR